MPGTVIEVLRRFLPAFLKGQPPLSKDQQRAIWAIEHCRTLALGWDLYACSDCGKKHFAYHSCNHKACPQCGRQATANWVQRELNKLVKAPYFMVNFTLPAQLRSFFLGPHAAKAFDVFFKTSSTALSQALANPKWLGAQVNGFTGILHTWNQQLLPHPHIHYIVPGAGLDAHGRLVRCKHQNFLLPTSELTRLFIAHWKQQLKDLQWDVDPEVWNKKWGVYIKAFGTGTHAVKYLGAYVSRTAIGDSRILEINDETVRFSWKDRSDGDKLKQLSLPGTEFVRRYLRHVLPKGLRSIRYFGFCHPAAKKNRSKIQFYSGKPLLVGPIDNPTHDPKSSPDYLCDKCSKPMDRIYSVGRDGKIKTHYLRGPPKIVTNDSMQRA